MHFLPHPFPPFLTFLLFSFSSFSLFLFPFFSFVFFFLSPPHEPKRHFSFFFFLFLVLIFTSPPNLIPTTMEMLPPSATYRRCQPPAAAIPSLQIKTSQNLQFKFYFSCRFELWHPTWLKMARKQFNRRIIKIDLVLYFHQITTKFSKIHNKIILRSHRSNLQHQFNTKNA